MLEEEVKVSTELYLNFEERVYRFCDNNVGEEVLFTGFVHLWPKQIELCPREEIIHPKIIFYTNNVINKLLRLNVLREIPKDFDTFYPMYNILAHDSLIKEEKVR